MITTVREFEDATAFERFALDRTVPLVSPDGTTMTLDLRDSQAQLHATARPRTIAIEITDTIGGVRPDAGLRPLYFGAAWKVLDLLVELSLTGRPPKPDRKKGAERSIAQKAANALSGSVAPFNNHPDLWQALAVLYDATKEIRHALVHRRVVVDLAGALSGSTQSGAVVTVSAAEQESFCRAVQRAAEAVIAGSLPARKRADLAWHLDQLAAHHLIRLAGTAPLGGQAIPMVLANLAPANHGQWSVELDWLRSEVIEVFPTAPYIDVELHVPDGSLRRYRGELENAPTGRQVIELDAVPAWLRAA